MGELLTNADFIGHIGYALIALGMYLLTLKNKWGWILRIAGGALWIVVGCLTDPILYSILTWGTLFLLIEINGFRKWSQEEEN